MEHFLATVKEIVNPPTQPFQSNNFGNTPVTFTKFIHGMPTPFSGKTAI